MSLSKRHFEEGYIKTVDYSDIKIQLGQRFIVKNRSNNSENGTWEVNSESNLKNVYYCCRVLKSGKVSLSTSRSNFRTFSSNEILEAIENNKH